MKLVINGWWAIKFEQQPAKPREIDFAYCVTTMLHNIQAALQTVCGIRKHLKVIIKSIWAVLQPIYRCGEKGRADNQRISLLSLRHLSCLDAFDDSWLGSFELHSRPTSELHHVISFRVLFNEYNWQKHEPQDLRRNVRLSRYESQGLIGLVTKDYRINV